MRKLTALLLCFLMLCMCSVTAFSAAPEREVTSRVISLTVPDTHKIFVEADFAQVFYEGIGGEEFTVGRLSQPRLLIRAESGKTIKSVTLNDEDVTDKIYGGYLTLSPVYEDKVLTVITEDEPAAVEETYTVKGKVTLNGLPLADVDLELRSTLKTAKTDSEGSFQFTDVAPGKHSLTALKDGKVIGYLSFELEKDTKTEIFLQESGSYTLFVDQNSAGVELHLKLNEEKGTLEPTEVLAVRKPVLLLLGCGAQLRFWWLLLIIAVACIVAIETYRRKKKQ